MFIELKKIKSVLCFVNSTKMSRPNLSLIAVFLEYHGVLNKTISKNKKSIVGRSLLFIYFIGADNHHPK